MSQVIKATAASSCYLSEDLLMEIIKRLPVKYILRCRCVEKSWYHLLSSPYFIALHSRSSNKYLLFSLLPPHMQYMSLHFDDKQKEYCDLQFPQKMLENFGRYSSKGSLVYETCNGLICVSSELMQEVYVWNPALRVFDVLPNCPIPTNDSLTTRVTTGLAFGYLAKTNDYKVIKCEEYSGTDTGDEFYIYVYSLSTDSWKTVKKGNCRGNSCEKVSKSVVVNGLAYWVGSKHQVRERENVIVCFDMENDTTREIMLPPPYSKKNDDSVVLVENSIFGELLSFIYYDSSTHVLHIWVLENVGESNEVWTKKTSIDFERSWWPMGFRNNGEMILKDWAGKFLSYDLEKEEAKDIVYDDYLGSLYLVRDLKNRRGELFYFGRYYPYHVINLFEETLILLDVNRHRSRTNVFKLFATEVKLFLTDVLKPLVTAVLKRPTIFSVTGLLLIFWFVCFRLLKTCYFFF